jgi:hypothetical protein
MECDDIRGRWWWIEWNWLDSWMMWLMWIWDLIRIWKEGTLWGAVRTYVCSLDRLVERRIYNSIDIRLSSSMMLCLLDRNLHAILHASIMVKRILHCITYSMLPAMLKSQKWWGGEEGMTSAVYMRVHCSAAQRMAYV